MVVVKSQRAMPPASPARPPSPPARLQVALALALLAAAAALGSKLLQLDEPAHASSRVEVRMLGGSVIPEGREPRTLAPAVARAWLRGRITLEAGEQRHALPRAALGALVDLEALTAQLIAAQDAGSPLRRLHAQLHGTAPLLLPVPARLEGEAARTWLVALADGLSEPARPARVELPSGRVIAPQPGRTLDVEGTLDALADAVYRGSSTVAARFRVQPAPAAPLAPHSVVDVSEVLGRGESALLDDDPTRAHNLRTAVRAVDGTLLAGAQPLDLRAQLSAWRVAGRFRAGPVIVGAPDAIEGPIAQLMRTLHMALIDAEMALLEEPFASDTPGELPNLRLESSLRHPCAIALEVREGRLHAEIRGTPADAVQHPRERP